MEKLKMEEAVEFISKIAREMAKTDEIAEGSDGSHQQELYHISYSLNELMRNFCNFRDTLSCTQLSIEEQADLCNLVIGMIGIAQHIPKKLPVATPENTRPIPDPVEQPGSYFGEITSGDF